MADCLFTSRGQTRAQLMVSALKAAGIGASTRKLPLKLANEGCAYGVAVAETTASVRLGRCVSRDFRPGGCTANEATTGRRWGGDIL